MNSSRRFAEAFGTMTQLGYANASLAFYSGVPEGRDLAQVYDAAYGRYAAVPNPEGTHTYAAFTHLGGYGASVYTYQWSQDRKNVVAGKSVSVLLDLGGCRLLKKKTN